MIQAAINLIPATRNEIAEIIISYWHGGGWLMLPLALITFLIWQRYLSLSSCLKEAAGTPPEIIEEIRREISGGHNFASIELILKNKPGAIPELIRGLLPRLRHGLSFREAFQECRTAAMSSFNYAFFILAALVAAAPLLGLLGTVMGMIKTFDAVGGGSGATAMLVADGISQALITTQVGLAAALPGTLGLAHLYRLYRQLDNDIELCESQLYTAFEQRKTFL